MKRFYYSSRCVAIAADNDNDDDDCSTHHLDQGDIDVDVDDDEDDDDNGGDTGNNINCDGSTNRRRTTTTTAKSSRREDDEDRIATAARQFTILTCRATACTAQRQRFGQDEFATYSAFSVRAVAAAAAATAATTAAATDDDDNVDNLCWSTRGGGRNILFGGVFVWSVCGNRPCRV
jgi:hypothetical protein